MIKIIKKPIKQGRNLIKAVLEKCKKRQVALLCN